MTAGSVTSVRDVHQRVFDHVDGLTGGGLFEHALHTLPRRERGYRAGNVTRGLVVLCREPEPRPPAAQRARRISEPE